MLSELPDRRRALDISTSRSALFTTYRRLQVTYATREKQPCGCKIDLLTTGSGPQELGHIMMADQLSLITPKCVRESRFLGLYVILIGAGDVRFALWII